jgi:hypothetical protein
LEKKSSGGKPKTETIFAPSASDAWDQAPSILPKNAKIVDVVREGEKPEFRE